MSATPRPDLFGFGSWVASAVGTNAGVTATHTINTKADHCEVSSISASSDAAALVTIESPAGTVIWRQRFAAAFTMNVPFPVALPGASVQNVLVKVSASTTNSEANIVGYDV